VPTSTASCRTPALVRDGLCSAGASGGPFALCGVTVCPGTRGFPVGAALGAGHCPDAHALAAVPPGPAPLSAGEGTGPAALPSREGTCPASGGQSPAACPAGCPAEGRGAGSVLWEPHAALPRRPLDTQRVLGSPGCRLGVGRGGTFATNGKNKPQFSTTSAFNRRFSCQALSAVEQTCWETALSLCPSWRPGFRFLLWEEPPSGPLRWRRRRSGSVSRAESCVPWRASPDSPPEKAGPHPCPRGVSRVGSRTAQRTV